MNDIDALRRIRQTKKITLREMAADLGVTIATLHAWLHKTRKPSPLAADRIKAYLIAAVEGR